MKILNLENYKTWQLVLLIALVILIVPPLLVLPALYKFWNFSGSASIGETIGGITSPFINGLAAILVFIAFKAQIKANEVINNQEKARNILSQIALIQDDKLESEKTITVITNRAELLGETSTFPVINQLNKVLFFTSEIRLANELINEYTGEKDFLYRKLHFLYKIRYQAIFLSLEYTLKNYIKVNMDYRGLVADILFQIKFLNDNLEDVNKYSIK